jgi:hypothetical protein
MVRGPFSSNHVCCNSHHAIRESRPESSLNLLSVRCRVASRQDDALRQLSPALGDGAEVPFEPQRCSIQRHFDRERASGLNFANPPSQGLSLGHQSCALSALGEWTVQQECGRGIAPVRDLGPKVNVGLTSTSIECSRTRAMSVVDSMNEIRFSKSSG